MVGLSVFEAETAKNLMRHFKFKIDRQTFYCHSVNKE